MNCKKCGAELQEGSKFCANCGQPVEMEAVAEGKIEAEATQEQNSGDVWNEIQPQEQSQVQPQSAVEKTDEVKKTDKKKFIFGGVAVALVAVLFVGIFAGAKIVNTVKKATMSTTEYYQYVEKLNRDESKDNFVGYYDALRSSYVKDELNKKVSMKVTVSDTAKSLLSLSGVDLSSLDNAQITMQGSQKDGKYSNLITLDANDNQLVSMKTYMDMSAKKAYCQIPELSSSYLDLSSSLEQMSSDEDFNQIMQLYDLNKVFPETDDLEAIYEKYTDMVIDSAKDVEKEDTTCEAEGVSQDVTAYTWTIAGSEITDLAQEVLKQLKDDENVRNIITNADDSIYSNYVSAVEEAISEVADSQDSMSTSTAEIKTYISGNEIVGRTITLKDDSQNIVINMLCPRNNNEFGMLFDISDANMTYGKITGSGEIKSGKLSGDFAVNMDDSFNTDTSGTITTLQNVLKIKVADYDMTKVSEGEVSGTVTYSTDAVAQLTTYALKIESDGNFDKATSKVSIMAGEDELATVDMTMEDGSEIEDVVPGDSDTVYDVSDYSDMSSYQSEIDVEAFLADLQEKTGIDFTSLASSYMYGNSSDSYSDDYNSYYDDYDSYSDDYDSYSDDYDSYYDDYSGYNY